MRNSCCIKRRLNECLYHFSRFFRQLNKRFCPNDCVADSFLSSAFFCGRLRYFYGIVNHAWRMINDQWPQRRSPTGTGNVIHEQSWFLKQTQTPRNHSMSMSTLNIYYFRRSTKSKYLQSSKLPYRFLPEVIKRESHLVPETPSFKTTLP